VIFNRSSNDRLPPIGTLANPLQLNKWGGKIMLEIANLSHTYANGTVALADVNLSIPRGMFGLLGPNGAGKSTLMRTVATLQEPTQGSIKFGEIDVLAEPERLRRTLGYLPQDFGVYPRVSA
jgi:ABC-type multidrug transport system ATPase subunit